MRVLSCGAFALVVTVTFTACGSADESGLVGSTPTGSGAATSAGGGSGIGGEGSGGTEGGGGAAEGGAVGAGGKPTLPPGFTCDSTADCAPYGKICQTVVGTCVDCLSNTDCEGGAQCRIGVCEAPVACTTPTDCAGAPDGRRQCEMASGDCVQCILGSHCPSGQCTGNRCVGGVPSAGGASGAGGAPFGAGGFDGAGGLGGAGEGNPGGADGAGGTVVLGDAWARCTSNAQCVGERTCTAGLQELTQPGRDGACVNTCLTGSPDATCDPLPPGGGRLLCLSFGVGICTIACGSDRSCPTGLECVGSFCYHKDN